MERAHRIEDVCVDGDAACGIQGQGWRTRCDVFKYLTADRDIARLDTHAGGVDDDTGAGVEAGLDAAGQYRGVVEDWREGGCVSAVGGAADGDVVGVEQPVAGLARWRRGVNRARGLKVVMARCFHLAAIATLRPAPRHDGAVEAGIGLRPQHRRAASADFCGAHVDASGVCHDHGLRCLKRGQARFISLPVAADQYGAAAGFSRGINERVVPQANLFAGERDVAAAPTRRTRA